MKSRPHVPSRRRFLKTALSSGAVLGSGALLTGCEPSSAPPPPAPAPEAAVPALPSGLKAENFIVHGTSPMNLESPRSVASSAITPNDRMYVRANLPMPPAQILDDRDAWVLSVEGVAEPRDLTLGELKNLGITTVVSVVQCSGNGRYWFEHDPSGSQWQTGAAANVVWTGVPVRAVAEALGGVADGMRFLTGTGGEPIPEGLEERKVVIERSVPIDKGLADCLLAWEMNGEPIPLAYGGPLRLIVPGYYGVNQVKYVKRLAFTAAESDAKIQRTSYRVRPIGEKGAPEQPSMWAMSVKSWITAPLGDEPVPAGRVQVIGVALAGENTVEEVEVSTDGGGTWHPASFFGNDFGPFGWRQFVYAFDAAPGELVLASRARDSAGNQQGEHRSENHRGYGHNGWRDHSVSIVVA
jgi:DMSO/TMAO reductase YedYZ molybdopterin-dependent catalytic subunit